MTVFDAAKSVAVSSVRGLINGKRPVNQVAPIGDVSVTTTVSGSDVITVQVTGKCSGAVGTVLYKYDTTQKKVTDWEENVPLP